MRGGRLFAAVSRDSGGVIYSLDNGAPQFVYLVTFWGSAGQTIEILGQGFTGATSVKFGTTAASFNVVSDTYMTALVPASGDDGPTEDLTVTTAAGTLTGNRKFILMPLISGIAPASGAVGTSVTISGSGFIGTTAVRFGSVKATAFTVNSGNSITSTVPAGATTGKVSVTTGGGSASSKNVFTVTP